MISQIYGCPPSGHLFIHDTLYIDTKLYGRVESHAGLSKKIDCLFVMTKKLHDCAEWKNDACPK